MKIHCRSTILSYFSLTSSIILFITIKLLNFSPRFSDASFYFYLAYHLGKTGKLYQDFFFTNLPFLPYFLRFWQFLGVTWRQLQFFPVLEAIGATILIYYLLKKEKVDTFWRTAGAIIFLFSFTVLSTSDYETGVHLANFLTLFSVFLLAKNKSWQDGIVGGLAAATKIYTLPVFLGISLWYSFHHKKKTTIFWSSFLLTIFLLIIPFLISSPHQFFKQIIFYNFTKPTGIPKIKILTFFLKREWAIIIISLTLLFMIRKLL